MNKLTVQKNKSLFKKGWIHIPKVCLSSEGLYKGSVIFTEESKYILDSGDQIDFNKGYGLADSLVSNFKTTIMLGWRYIPSTDIFELTPYAHDGSNTPIYKRDAESGAPIIYKTAKVNEKVDYWILVKGDLATVFFSPEGLIRGEGVEFKYKDSFSFPLRVVDYWFGGGDSNNDGLGGKAPAKLSLLAEFKKIR